MMLKKMKISSQLKGGIYEVSFRYNTNLGGYATLLSDIPKLSEMANPSEVKNGIC
jgi:hypothetical protein